jgi:trans-2,3-dihydro-3-hydroxyanthranilate isomerase
MRRLPYALCDVFTDRPLAGNALAVFTDANGLDRATMQALARETNLSESAFVLRPTTPEADVRIRIFTPTMELPFAGHPTLGSAFVLADSLRQEVLRLETGKGIVTVRLTREGGRPVFGWMTQPLPRIESFTATAELFAALGVNGSKLPVDLYDNGPHYAFVELGSPEEVSALRPDLGRLAALGSTAFSVFARNGDRWKTRVFAPGEGIPEDPATGAAAGPHALHLARYEQIRFGDKVLIEQGAEIGRPSTLHAFVVGNAERIERVEVGGSAVVVARGEFSFAWPESE